MKFFLKARLKIVSRVAPLDCFSIIKIMCTKCILSSSVCLQAIHILIGVFSFSKLHPSFLVCIHVGFFLFNSFYKSLITVKHLLKYVHHNSFDMFFPHLYHSVKALFESCEPSYILIIAFGIFMIFPV